jgi:transposase
VNNQRTNNCITSDYKLTGKLYILNNHTPNWLQTLFINQTSPHFSYILSTLKNIKNNLLNKSFTLNPQRLLIELLNEN